MQVSIETIKIKEGRRSLDAVHVEELVSSMGELGLLNPVTIDRENFLIAGMHRLEAAKALGWTGIECTVSSLEGLQAELAEIDENFVRNDLTAVEYGEMLLRRKEIYEMLHPETKHGGDRRSEEIKTSKCRFENTKSFVQDTAEKLGVGKRTVERQIQTAKNLTPEAKEIIKNSNAKISKRAALELSQLEPGQQKEAASLLASGEIKKVEEYKAETIAGAEPVYKPQDKDSAAHTKHSMPEPETQRQAEPGREDVKPGTGKMSELETQWQAAPGKEGLKPDIGTLAESEIQQVEPDNAPILPAPDDAAPDAEQEGRGASLAEIIADLKNPDKDCSCTPDIFMQEYDAFVRKFHRELEWYGNPYYDTVYPFLTDGQLAGLREMTDSVGKAAGDFFKKVETTAKTERNRKK